MYLLGKTNLNRLLILSGCMLYLLSCAVLNAAIPKYITFQGRLTDVEGNPVENGTYTLSFRLYAAETGGDAIWTETQSVVVTNSVFNAALGTKTAFELPFDSEYWLTVQITGDSEMAPRQRLTATGYALNADSLNTYQSEQFLRSDVNDTASGQLTLTYPGTALIVQPSSTPEANTKIFNVKDVSGSTQFSLDYEGDLASQTATINDSLVVGTDVFTVNAVSGYVGIGTAAPAKVLHVVGDADILGDLAIGTEAIPKDMVVKGNLNVAGDQIIEGSTNYEGDLIIGADGAGHDVQFYSDSVGKYLSWDDSNAKMSLVGGSNLEVAGNLDVGGIVYLTQLQLDDDEKIILGTNQNVEIYVDSNDDLYMANVNQLEVAGDIALSGRIRQGSFGDLAEMMPLASGILNPAELRLTPAEVVIIDENGGVRRSVKAFAGNVVGIISTNPAQILRDGMEEAVPVALNGVVPCKVTCENGPIRPGDLLVSSSVPGHAMRAGKDPLPGTVIGKALERLDQDTGVIEVLVMMK